MCPGGEQDPRKGLASQHLTCVSQICAKSEWGVSTFLLMLTFCVRGGRNRHPHLRLSDLKFWLREEEGLLLTVHSRIHVDVQVHGTRTKMEGGQGPWKDLAHPNYPQGPEKGLVNKRQKNAFTVLTSMKIPPTCACMV